MGKKKGSIGSLFVLVGISGFELATSWSQTQKHRFFASFCVLFLAFSSENRAFSCRNVHNSHVVQTCKWSKLWSERNSMSPHADHIPPLAATSHETKVLPEVDFIITIMA